MSAKEDINSAVRGLSKRAQAGTLPTFEINWQRLFGNDPKAKTVRNAVVGHGLKGMARGVKNAIPGTRDAMVGIPAGAINGTLHAMSGGKFLDGYDDSTAWVRGYSDDLRNTLMNLGGNYAKKVMDKGIDHNLKRLPEGDRESVQRMGRGLENAMATGTELAASIPIGGAVAKGAKTLLAGKKAVPVMEALKNLPNASKSIQVSNAAQKAVGAVNAAGMVAAPSFREYSQSYDDAGYDALVKYKDAVNDLKAMEPELDPVEYRRRYEALRGARSVSPKDLDSLLPPVEMPQGNAAQPAQQRKTSYGDNPLATWWNALPEQSQNVLKWAGGGAGIGSLLGLLLGGNGGWWKWLLLGSLLGGLHGGGAFNGILGPTDGGQA